MNLDLYNDIKQIETADDKTIQIWMQEDSTMEKISNCFVFLNPMQIRKLLCIVYMNIQTEVFSDDNHDKIMKKESKRFYTLFVKYLEISGNSIEHEITRVIRFYDAWSRQDQLILKQFDEEFINYNDNELDNQN